MGKRFVEYRFPYLVFFVLLVFWSFERTMVEFEWKILVQIFVYLEIMGTRHAQWA